MYETLMQVIVNGLLLGGVYSLLAVGLNIIYGAMDLVNFAHGDFLMLSMFTAFWLFTLLGIDPFISVPLCAAVLSLVGVAVQLGLIERIIKAPAVSQIIITFGLSLVLRSGALLVWGMDYKTIDVPYKVEVLVLGPLRFPYTSLVSFAISLLTCAVLFVFLEKTDVGTALRATSQDREAAALMGVNIRRMFMLAFAIGAACAGVSGALLSTFYPIYPDAGVMFTFTALIVCVVGGLGSYVGTFFGGLIIGIAEMLGGFLVSPQYRTVVSFIIFIVILLIRPRGLFGK
jgi:branched-chain amino acid transport system permease protein